MIRHFYSRQFAIFLLTGGFAALVNFTSRIFYNRWMNFSEAVICAYITGMITAFLLARMFVFRETTRAVHHAAWIFTLVNLVAALQTWAISVGFAYYVLPMMDIHTYDKEIAHALGVATPVFTSYLGHKKFSFR